MVFPVVMHGCESWTIKKAERWRTDAFELWCWRRLLRVPWTARSSNLSILKEKNPEYSLEGLMLKLKLQYFGHLMWRTTVWFPFCEASKMIRVWEKREQDGDSQGLEEGWHFSHTRWQDLWYSNMHTANNMGDGHLKTAKRVNWWYAFSSQKQQTKNYSFMARQNKRLGPPLISNSKLGFLCAKQIVRKISDPGSCLW